MAYKITYVAMPGSNITVHGVAHLKDDGTGMLEAYDEKNMLLAKFNKHALVGKMEVDNWN